MKYTNGELLKRVSAMEEDKKNEKIHAYMCLLLLIFEYYCLFFNFTKFIYIFDTNELFIIQKLH
jgi:hypothetical protein